MNSEIKKEIDDLLSNHIQEENLKFEQLFSDIKELRKEMAAFTEAWQQAKGLSLLGSAVFAKGKEFIEDKLGVSLEESVATEEGLLKLKLPINKSGNINNALHD